MDNSLEKPQVWERLPEETDLQYMAFMCYLELDSPSLEAAYRSYYQKRFPDRWQEAVASGEESTIKASGSFSEWAKVHVWTSRREAYYDDLYKTVLEQLRTRQIKAMIDHADLGKQLRETAQEALDAISATTKYVALSEEDGREIWILESSLKPHEIAKLAELGVTIENKVFGNPDSVQEHTHKVDPKSAEEISKIASTIRDRSEKYVDAYAQLEKNLADLGITPHGDYSKN
jgi:hypothetical protein